MTPLPNLSPTLPPWEIGSTHRFWSDELTCPRLSYPTYRDLVERRAEKKIEEEEEKEKGEVEVEEALGDRSKKGPEEVVKYLAFPWDSLPPARKLREIGERLGLPAAAAAAAVAAASSSRHLSF